ncbi:MAG: UDP-N-acetylglucosamine 2-epimerase [Bacteroidota bacterium]
MRDITIVTGTRAEYGLLKPLIRKLEESPLFNLSLVVTGMHLSAEFGLTYREIENDGVKIAYKIDTLLSSDSSEAITKSIGLGLISFADLFQTVNTDLLIVLGDRTELLSACIAALVKGIPIAHISGGETTEGAYDEAIRHSITKMSHIHFTATDDYTKRVIQLGEQPKNVFNVGAVGIDSIKNLKLLTKQDFERSIDFNLNKKNLLVTFHPVTLEKNSAEVQFNELLRAIEPIEDTNIIFTKPNSDKGGRIIIKLIDDFVSKNPQKAIAFDSLGQLRYLSALQFVDAVVGNSSSGIVEVPYFKIPTINIGERQKGRNMPESVINCDPTTSEINNAIKLALSAEFKDKIANVTSPYGDGHATQRIFDILSGLTIDSVKKTFYDL